MSRSRTRQPTTQGDVRELSRQIPTAVRLLSHPQAPGPSLKAVSPRGREGGRRAVGGTGGRPHPLCGEESPRGSMPGCIAIGGDIVIPAGG
jgi:hypothetical protein